MTPVPGNLLVKPEIAKTATCMQFHDISYVTLQSQFVQFPVFTSNLPKIIVFSNRRFSKKLKDQVQQK
jgi:hypothetical protein